MMKTICSMVLAGACWCANAQTDSKPKVLFERHEPAAVDTPDPAADAAPPTPAAGVSSSAGKRGLKRRVPAEGDTQAAPDLTTPPGVSSSVQDAVDVVAPVTITAADQAAADAITAALRAAVRIVATDLDMHLNTHTGELEMRARLTMRNDGAAAMQRVPLQISSALKWESARVMTGGATAMEQHHLASDLDHTGAVTEMSFALPQPLVPGATVALDLYYGGVLTQSADRLIAMGAPAGRAATVDWDTVTDTFTGLRGLGQVMWLPASAPPVFLRDGDVLPRVVEEARRRDAAGAMHLRLTLQYSGSRPDAAYFCGERATLQPQGDQSAAEGAAEGVSIAEWTRASLGTHTPSLFVADGAAQTAAGGLLRVVTDHADTVAALGEAAKLVRPMLTEWLGAAPAQPLHVLDLPIPDGAAFSDGAFVVMPLRALPAAKLAEQIVYPLTAAWLPAQISAPWLAQGLPEFFHAIFLERTYGRTAAFAALASPALAALDTAAPLATCSEPACARTKAAYVLEMLRAQTGDAALKQALSAWRVTVGKDASMTAAQQTALMQRLVQQTSAKDLTWLYRDWIDNAHTLPELVIVTVAPRRVEHGAVGATVPQVRRPVGGPIGAEPVPLPGDPQYVRPENARGSATSPAEGSWLVAVEVQNNGDAVAEVPVTVRAGGLTNTLPLRIAAHSRATVRVPFEAEPQEVQVNDGTVPEMRVTEHRRSITVPR